MQDKMIARFSRLSCSRSMAQPLESTSQTVSECSTFSSSSDPSAAHITSPPSPYLDAEYQANADAAFDNNQNSETSYLSIATNVQTLTAPQTQQNMMQSDGYIEYNDCL